MMLASIRAFIWRIVHFARHRKSDRYLDSELEFHLNMEIKENLRQGMNPERARRQALLALGGMDQTKEAYRDERCLRFIEDFIQDLRYGLRMLGRNPGFAVAAVLTLALGIGVNTAVFSVVNAVLIRPLPFDRPEEIVQIKSDSPMFGITSYFPNESAFVAFLQNAQTLAEVAAYHVSECNMSGDEGAERIKFGTASATFFPSLGVSPSLGRHFLEEEDRPGGEKVVILGNGLWKRRFGGDPDVLGRSVILDGSSYTIIGILPASFDLPGDTDEAELWMPMLSQERDKYSQSRPMWIIGRLRPSSQIQAASAELDSIYQSLPLSKALSSRALLSNWQEEITQNAKLPLLLFMGAVVFVLLIACCNVANLLLARAATREKEIAIRATVGARRIRLFRQLLTESLLMALMGAILGFTLAFWARNAIQSLVSENLVRISFIPIDPRVFGFTSLISILSLLIIGIIPALQLSRFSLGESLKEGSRSSMGPSFNRTRKSLVVIEVGLVVMLLIGAGLLFKSLWVLQQIDPGFRPERIFSMSVDLTLDKYPTARAQTAYFETVLDRLKKLPGVESAAANASLPLSGMIMTASGIGIEGRPTTTSDDDSIRFISHSPVSSDYFKTMGIPLLQGRAFTDTDREGAADVAIVDKVFVRRYSSGENLIGKRINSPFKRDAWLTVIGVVDEVRQSGLESEIRPHVYTSYLQSIYPIPRMGIVLRCARDPMSLAGSIRDVLKSIDPDQPVFDMMTMEDRLSDSLGQRKANSLLIGIFSALALILTLVGIYGVVSYTVSQRTHEIGICMALGARKSDVLWKIVHQTMGVCIIGILLGIGGALAGSRLISSLLYGVETSDAATFVAVAIFVISVTLIASYIPARKAAAVDPMRSLRYE